MSSSAVRFLCATLSTSDAEKPSALVSRMRISAVRETRFIDEGRMHRGCAVYSRDTLEWPYSRRDGEQPRSFAKNQLRCTVRCSDRAHVALGALPLEIVVSGILQFRIVGVIKKKFLSIVSCQNDRRVRTKKALIDVNNEDKKNTRASLTGCRFFHLGFGTPPA